MKKIKLLFVFILIVLAFSGCNKNTDVSENHITEPSVESKTEVIKSEEVSADILDWNEVSKFTGDLDGDGADENIMLVTSAERDKDGKFLWNDGQNWALYIDDREEDFLLFNQYLSAGYPYFEVSDYYTKNGAEPKIKLIISTGASFSVANYEFSKTDNGYKKNIIYDTAEITDGGINRRYSSFPEYDVED